MTLSHPPSINTCSIGTDVPDIVPADGGLNSLPRVVLSVVIILMHQPPNTFIPRPHVVQDHNPGGS